MSWLGDFGFRGMVVDEAHFIKTQDLAAVAARPRALSDRIRSRTARPLLMALTGTPLINDIEDFRGDLAVSRLDRRQQAPRRAGRTALEDPGLTPADRGLPTPRRASA